MANMTFKANLLPDNTGTQKELGSSTARWKIYGDLTGNADTANKLSTTGTTSQFWRGDNVWSDTFTDKLIISNTSTAAGQYSRLILGEKTVAANPGQLVLFSQQAVDGERARHNIYSLLTPDKATGSDTNELGKYRQVYFQNYDGAQFVVHTGTTATVGSETQPVYIEENGRVTGVTAIDIEHGGTGATTASVARTNLGVPTGNKGIFYGTCSTTASTTAKTVSCPEFTSSDLAAGTIMVIKFSNNNTTTNPTININETGAKAIMQYGTTKISNTNATSGWQAGAVCIFTYDGTNWIRNQGYNTNDNTQQRIYKSVADVELPLAGINGSASVTATVPAFNNSNYTNSYAAVPDATANLATINPSTGKITVLGGIDINNALNLTNTDSAKKASINFSRKHSYITFSDAADAALHIGTGNNDAGTLYRFERTFFSPQDSNALDLGNAEKTWKRTYSEQFIAGTPSYGTTHPNQITNWSTTPVLGQMYFKFID